MESFRNLDMDGLGDLNEVDFTDLQREFDNLMIKVGKNVKDVENKFI
jgi:hypothetical protein